MSATIATPVSAAKAWGHTVRLLIVAAAVVVLLAAAFVVGRTTSHSTVKRVPAIAPVSSSGSNTDKVMCRIGRPC